jgi:hypothetical protein
MGGEKMKSLNRRSPWAAVLAAGAFCLALQDNALADCGTAVDFVDTPAEAAKQALKEEKLVFILHVSGHFETPEYT